MDLTTITQPEFGLRVHALRKERRMSQRDLAGDSVNSSYISLIESGARVPTIDVAMQLAQNLQVSLSELIAGVTPARVPAGRTQLDDVAGAGATGGGPQVGSAATAPRAGDDRSRGAGLVSELLAASSREAGDLADAATRFRAVYDRGIAEHSPYVVLEAGVALLDILSHAGDTDGRLEITAQLVHTTAELGVPEAQVRVLVDRAAALRDAGELRAAYGVADRAVSDIAGTALANTIEEVRLLGVLTSIRIELDEFDADLEAAVDRMLALADAVGTDAVRGRAHWVAGLAMGHGEQVDAAARHMSTAAELLSTPTTSLRDFVRFSLAATTALLDSGGETEAAARHLTMAKTGLGLVDLPAEAVAVQLQDARLRLREGEAAEALALIDSAAPADFAAVDRAGRLTVRAQALQELGRVDDAIEDLREAVRLRELAGAYRASSQLWRKIDALRSDPS